MDKLRVGFIGVGRIADLHHLGYEDNPKAELYAVCDTDQGLVERRVSEWGVERAYSDYLQLLADSNVDAVEVITPHELHAEMCIAALQAGKYVSVQKPMDTEFNHGRAPNLRDRSAAQMQTGRQAGL